MREREKERERNRQTDRLAETNSQRQSGRDEKIGTITVDRYLNITVSIGILTDSLIH